LIKPGIPASPTLIYGVFCYEGSCPARRCAV
jgi:hypothetical protein